MKSPLERILAELGMPTLVDVLSAQLSATDLTSLLLEVMRPRAGGVAPKDVMRRCTSDRFFAAPAASFRSLRRAEAAAASEHLLIHTRALASLGARRITVSLTDFSGGRNASIADAVRTSLHDVPLVACLDDPEREGGLGYYRDFCFKVHAQFTAEPFETSDGGIVDGTQRLVGSAKERCFISGIGIDRLALALGSP